MPIDNSGSQLTPSFSELKVPEKKSNLGDKIRSILDHRTRQNPAETFHQLAQLSSNNPTEDQLSSTTSEIVPPSPHPPSNSDQQEITRLSNAIKQESIKTNTPETSTDKLHLFPDRPSLYDQNHQKYDRERQTIIGRLTRSRDISKLKKGGLDDNGQFYDSLRERGFSRDQIFHKTGYPILQIVKENQYRPPNQQIDLPKLLNSIDRLYSINALDSNSFNDINAFLKKIDFISTTSDQDFLQIKDQLNTYSSLKDIDPLILFNHQGLFSPDNKNKFFTPDHQPKPYFFELLINDIPIDSIRSSLNQHLSTFPDQKDQHVFLGILNLKQPDRRLVNTILCQYKDTPEPFFTPDGQPTSIYFQKAAIECIGNNSHDLPVDLNHPILQNYFKEKLPANFSPEEKFMWSNILDKKITDPIALRFLFKNKQNINSFFTPDHQPTAKLFESIAQQHYLNDNFIQFQLTPDVINTFPKPADRQLWLGILNLKYPERKVIQSIINHKDKAELFFTPDHQPTDFLFQTLYFDDKVSYYDFQSFLISKIESVFSPQDQKKWLSLLDDRDGHKRQDILKFISSNHQDQSEPFFTPDYQLTSHFFKTALITDIPYLDKSMLNVFLTPEVIATFPPEDQQFWQNIFTLKDADLNIIKFLINNKDKNNIFFTPDHQPTSQLFKDLIKNNIPQEKTYLHFLKTNITPEVIATFPPEDQQFWKILTLKDINPYIIKEFILTNTKPDSFFTPNGTLKPVFFQTLFDHDLLESNCFNSNLTPEVIASFPESEQKAYQAFLLLSSRTNNPLTKRFIFQNKELISQKINSSVNPLETANQYAEVINQINSSPSKEILKIKDQLIIEILSNPHPLEAYQKISDIFVKNNLPMVGKIYRVFDVLYPPEKIKQMLRSYPELSRVLVNSQSSHLRQAIIFNDLLKVNLGSGEISLVNYLNLFQTNSVLLEKARSGINLTQSENTQLSSFFKKLDTLYDSSLLSRIQSPESLDTSTLQSKIDQLYQKYQVKPESTISDRVTQMYLSGLGIKTISEALSYVKQSKESAHNRNLSQTEFSISPGDLVKGVKSENLGNILNFGCVSREYLGSDAGSDSTPFDADTIRSDSIHQASEITSVGLSGYGDLFIVIKDRGQLQDTTNTPNPKYDFSKLEIFHSAKDSIKHYGVRTGFPSSEINFLVATDISPQKTENIFYEIAKKGVYIPVLNSQGQQIFTPADYQRYRHSFDGVKQFNGDPIQLETSTTKDPFRREIDAFKQVLKTESIDEVTIADTQIKEKIQTILDSLGINLKDQFDTSILGSRLYNIGSSGRHTNLPGDFDFDYNIVLDNPNYSKLNSVIDEIKKQFSHQGEISSLASQIRLTEVDGITPDTIDLDIGVNTTASTLIFASHEAIEQKLDSIKQTYGEDTCQEVIANILLAKKILKENHAYKKGDQQDGGFGGIGTENWILYNNGSIKKAFETFWQAAHENKRELTLDEFRKRYFILDPGENLRDTGRNHDNFIFALTEKGYKSMLDTIKKYLS